MGYEGLEEGLKESKKPKEGDMFQQGDVILERVENVKGKKLNHLILAEGEMTGHSHVITKGKAELYENEKELFLKIISNTAELTHQEHKIVVLPKGNFKVRKVREYDHFMEESWEVKD